MKQDSTQIQELEKKHTELPWHVYEGGNFVRIAAEGYEEFVERKHYLGGPLCVASLHYNASVNYESDHDKAMANAELIVRCVNSHDALVEALKEMVGVEYRHGSPAKRDAEYLAAVEKARAALAAAKE